MLLWAFIWSRANVWACFWHPPPRRIHLGFIHTTLKASLSQSRTETLAVDNLHTSQPSDTSTQQEQSQTELQQHTQKLNSFVTCWRLPQETILTGLNNLVCACNIFVMFIKIFSNDSQTIRAVFPLFPTFGYDRRISPRSGSRTELSNWFWSNIHPLLINSSKMYASNEYNEFMNIFHSKQ